MFRYWFHIITAALASFKKSYTFGVLLHFTIVFYKLT